MSAVRTVQGTPRRAATPARRSPARRTQRDSETLVVTILTFLATGISLYDLLLLGLAAN